MAGADLALFSKLFFHYIDLWWVIIPAIVLGVIVGALPGFNAQNTLIIMLPFTLTFPVDVALTFMVALYCASHLGGGIPAILVNIPGNGGAAATCLDGYPMAKKGQGQQALILCFTSSVFGGLITTILTLMFLPYLARIGYYMHSVEMVIVMLFGLTLIAVIAAQDMLKGLIAGFLGLMIGAIGTDHIYNTPRGTFGFLELYDGMPLVPALIGLFAISEALVFIEDKTIVANAHIAETQRSAWSTTIEGLVISAKKWWLICWAAFIGMLVGIVPGAGASIASFVAYQQARMFSKTPHLFGTGVPDGVLAPEAANNGVTSGTLVPMMAIGVPGGSTAAVMMIVLQYHGIVFGPRLFLQSPDLAYGVFMGMFVTYLFMIGSIIFMARWMARITLVPTEYLAPLIMTFTIVGAFAEREYIFDMGIAVLFGVIGYVARKTGYHVTSLLIGILLGPLFEQYLLRALRISQGDVSVFFTSTLGNVLWALLLLSLLIPWLRTRKMAATGALKEYSDA